MLNGTGWGMNSHLHHMDMSHAQSEELEGTVWHSHRY